MNELQKVVGEAEIDESYFGAKRVRGSWQAQARQRHLEAASLWHLGARRQGFYEIVPDCKKKTL